MFLSSKKLWQFNVASKRWYLLETTGDMPNLTVASPSVAIHGNVLIVYGGTGDPFGADLSNSIYLCNLKNLVWKRLDTHGEPPLKLYGSSLIIKDGYLYILFGTSSSVFCCNVYKINLSTLESVKLFDSTQLLYEANFIELQNLELEYPNDFLSGRYLKNVNIVTGLDFKHKISPVSGCAA